MKRICSALSWRRLALALVAGILTSLGVAAAQRPVPVTGSIPNPTGKSGTVVAWAGYFDMSPTGAVSFGEVASDGAFSMDLPAQLRGDVLHPLEAKNLCQGGGQDLKLQPRGVTHVMVGTLMAFDTTRLPVTATLATSHDLLDRLAADKHDVRAGDALGYYFYAGSAMSATGSCMGADGLSIEFDLQASAGWNRVVYAFETRGDQVVGRFSTVRSFPADLTWIATSR